MKQIILRTLASAVLTTLLLPAQDIKRIGIHVTETAGIRRTGFPVDARVLFPRAVLRTSGTVRLMQNGKEVPAQYSAESQWPDGSVEWLNVDFNASLGPSEKLDYQLEYGEGVAPAESPKGLAVEAGGDFIQSGSIRFSRGGSPLLLSVKYRSEEIGPGLNGLFVVDATGKRFDVTNAAEIRTEVLKSGPLLSTVRYSGYIDIDAAYKVPFALMVEMPNSKTLVKITAVAIDPDKRLREIAFETPLKFAGFPLVWDFGTPRWTYGSLRSATDAAELTQTGEDWTVATTSAGKEQIYETAGLSAQGAVRWGHIQDSKEVVAFALEARPEQTGTWRMKVEGSGQLSFRYATSTPSDEHRITVYEHFVTTPVQIGAATSPSALLNQLKVTVDQR